MDKDEAVQGVDENHKNFRSTSGEPVRIALTSGHIKWVQTDWTITHKRFWSHAFALGCESEDGEGKSENIEGSTLDQRKEKILEVMREFRDADDNDKPGLFTKAGVPDANRLSEKLGFTVKTDERNVLWQELKETEGDGD